MTEHRDQSNVDRFPSEIERWPGDETFGPTVRVHLAPAQRVVDVGQAIGRPMIILNSFGDSHLFLTVPEARSLARAITEATDWQEEHGPIREPV